MTSDPSAPNDPLCTACNHHRSAHGEEMPYECYAGLDVDDDCECEGFSYLPKRPQSASPLPPQEARTLTFREWLCQGGGGFEDGEAGIRACTMPMSHVIELVDEYLESEVANGRDILPRANSDVTGGSPSGKRESEVLAESAPQEAAPLALGELQRWSAGPLGVMESDTGPWVKFEDVAKLAERGLPVEETKG